MTCRDANGFPTSERAFGGTVTPPTDLCSANHPRNDGESLLKHQWTFSTSTGLVTHESSFVGATFRSTMEVFDLNTLLPKETVDPTGLSTTYSYDTSSRIKTLQPPGVQATSYEYSNASAQLVTWQGGSKVVFTPANVVASTSASGFGTVKAQYQYDAGRLWREKTWMPDDTWTVRETLYNDLGQKASTSESETLVVPPRSESAPPGEPDPTEVDFVPAEKTIYSNYDPFGRVGAITAADSRQIGLAYRGSRVTTRTQQIAGPGGDQYVVTEERMDAHGRLISVTEAAVTSRARTTRYEYDYLGNLAKVKMPGESGTQERTFEYDDRGLLKSETHPELGASGHGKTEYLEYDATGKFRRRRTGTANGPFDLRFDYDAAGRLTKVKMASDATKVLKEFLYDDPAGSDPCSGIYCGKLRAAGRYNYTSDLGTIGVAEGWQYHSATGLPARRDVTVGGTQFETHTFFHTQTPNVLGGIDSIAYPCRSGAANCDDHGKTLTYKYDNGPLSEVEGWAKLTYQPNGMVANVQHGKIVNNAWIATASEAWTADPDNMSRPRKITVTKVGGPEHWTTGQYGFDATGNITAIGGTAYAYDPFGRLLHWRSAASNGGVATTTMVYDAFGNQLTSQASVCGPSVNGFIRCSGPSALGRTVTGTTNHYTDATYDDAGNTLTDRDRTFTYDALNMMTSATVGTSSFRFVYDPSDERVAAIKVGTPNKTTFTLRGFRNELLRVFTQDGTATPVWKEDEIWRGTSLLGLDTPNGRRHYALDHLGSPRVIMDNDGALLGTQEFEPFGAGGMTGTGALQFTGHERDRATLGEGAVDLPDYAHARSLDTGGGRFLSVDPAKMEKLSAENPQLFNRYAYAAGNPLRYKDPDGRVIFDSAATKRDYYVARQYLTSSRLGAYFIAEFEALSGPSEPVLMETNARHGSFFDEDRNVIGWVPDEGGLVTGPGAIPSPSGSRLQTPALGLLHEIAHTIRFNKDRAGFLRDVQTFTQNGSDAEEDHATRVESAVARELGEARRSQYTGLILFRIRETLAEMLERRIDEEGLKGK